MLPFLNMSSDPENEHFSDGLTDELINRLARVLSLQVVARTSTFRFKGQNEDLREVGAKLNVGSVMEGSVRKPGDQLRSANCPGTRDRSRPEPKRRGPESPEHGKPARPAPGNARCRSRPRYGEDPRILIDVFFPWLWESFTPGSLVSHHDPVLHLGRKPCILPNVRKRKWEFPVDEDEEGESVLSKSFVLAAVLATSLSATTIGLWSTGVCSGQNTNLANCSAGPGSLLNLGVPDNNYRYTSRVDGGSTGNNSSLAEPAYPTYKPNDSGSEWIGPVPLFANEPPGLYIVQTEFDLTGFNAPSLIVSLTIWVDNAVSLKVNGNSVAGFTQTCGTNAAAPRPWCFEIPGFTSIALTNANIGGSGWLPGLNTLEFDIQNTDSITTQTGLLVQVQGNASVSAVPEPATWALLGAGLAGLGLLRRRIA